MSGDERGLAAAEARRWLEVARRDIATAGWCLKAEPSLTEAAAYHCQQAAEKILKSMLVFEGIQFPKTHDLKILVNLVAPFAASIGERLDDVVPISVWGFAYRYPFEEEVEAPPDKSEVAAALARIAALGRRVEALIG